MATSTIDLVIGSQIDPGAVQQLIDELARVKLTDATLYIGYPILSTADESLSLDAILTSQEHSIIIFDIRAKPPQSVAEWELLEEHQAELVIAFKSKLIKHRELTKRRELAIPIHVVTFLPDVSQSPDTGEDINLADRSSIATVVFGLAGIDGALIRHLNAAIQQVTTIKPRKKRLNVTRDNSRGGKLKIIEREIANLDRWQKKAAIECPEGPQRIRGLAGSGKTVVLALKAAYLHAQHPEWTIAVTFQTRSLYGQIRDLIRRFTFENIQDEPDWDRLLVLHAWGSSSSPGTYSTIAKANNLPVQSFSYAKQRYLSTGAFEGVCGELLKDLDSSVVQPFDAILVDEAQDFGSNFFRLLYQSVKDPKRLVWAYDDLQSLKETGIPNLSELFGRNDSGQPLVSLSNEDGRPQQDIILPVCYRNTPWALSIAHGLGFGVYRQDGMIQCFDKTSFWEDIGYGVAAGALNDGQRVSLERRSDATPQFFCSLLSPDDAVMIRRFQNDAEETAWVAEQICKAIQEEELDPSDILIIIANPLGVERAAGPLRSNLRKRGIESHVAGVTRSADEFTVPNSVVISGIYRAKGNESPMVFVVGSQYCYGAWGANIRRRNILFTAMTRSRAWVRVTGVGDEFGLLVAEWNLVVESQFQLRFQVPTEPEREKMRQINRERTENEIRRIEKSKKSLAEVVEQLERQELALDDIPPELRRKLSDALKLKKEIK